MKQGIKVKDIRDFKKAVERLDKVLKRIQQYKPRAYIYVTPSQINLMSEHNDEESTNQDLIVTSGIIVNLDCGDW